MIARLVLKLAVLLTIVCVDDDNFVRSAKPRPSEAYTNELLLIKPDVYYLYWNKTETYVLFELHVKTNGWLGFGLSPNGGMLNSDVIVAFIHANGTHHFTDRHVTSDYKVIVDSHQDWQLVSMRRADEYLVVKFSRLVKTCDPEDIEIETGTPFVIYSFGRLNDQCQPVYHGPTDRGSQAVPLISSINDNIQLNMDEIDTHDFIVNGTVDSIGNTIYRCAMFQLPDRWLKKRQHLVRYETLMTPGNEKFIHHWILYECSHEFENEYLKNHSWPEPGVCFPLHRQHPKSDFLKVMPYCKRTTFDWGIGSPIIQDFPADIAYPIGGPDAEFKYFYMEVHYNNPELRPAFYDRIGVRFYVTEKLRKTEFGVLIVGGDEFWQGINIPPRADRFDVDYSCRESCLNHLYPEDTQQVKVFATLPHAHAYGKEIYSSIVRDGKEVEYLVKNRYYDFNYQYYNFLKKPVVLKKGDQIKTRCVFSTKNTDEFVYGGFTSKDEMCYVFLWYYPKNPNVSYCSEQIPKVHWKDFLEQLDTDGLIALHTNITESTTSISMEAVKADATLHAKYKDFYDNTIRKQACTLVNEGNIFTFNKRIISEPIKQVDCTLK